MRIPAPPPGFTVHGGDLSRVSHGAVAANSGHGPATAAQGMAALHEAMQGLPCDQGDVAKAAVVRARVACALEAVNTDRDIQSVRVLPSSRADGLAQLFGGERTCP